MKNSTKIILIILILSLGAGIYLLRNNKIILGTIIGIAVAIAIFFTFRLMMIVPDNTTNDEPQEENVINLSEEESKSETDMN